MAMAATSNPIVTYPLRLDANLAEGSTSGGRSGQGGEISAFRYTFKPGSVSDIPGYVTHHRNGTKEVMFDIAVFDVREEPGKSRECVLVFDAQAGGYVLRLLPTTYHLTLNRNASSTTRPNTGTSQVSSASTGSSASVPLSGQRRPEPGNDVFGDTTPRPSKKPRPSEPSASQSKGSNGDPLAFALTPPSNARRSGKGGTKKATANVKAKKGKIGAKPNKSVKAPPVPDGKFKSAEIIEDSEEEYDLGEGQSDAQEPEDNDDDEFARMVGESLAEPDEQPLPEPLIERRYEDEESTSDEGEESDDDELGGARLVGNNGAPMNNGESEWL
ncbi:hypothetical protein BD324DRAFT_607235 [Kockovaella imperatae]|uniref:Transcription elongation factor Eaf N-terminal domain-containing protein n=1 Tax=Kockovaella imperatae TaxID=4999 RepID=A0A1Y1UQB5_9TREE|nr:hypothetical protein BD324DRAFT_607235 [Kockovaella imperatae]ORX40162.1 hypothetical protein BD324DRAFT_607235 [Kockovaella imperatae]